MTLSTAPTFTPPTSTPPTPMVPGLGPAAALVLPPISDRVLGNGLRVLAAQRRRVPLVEVRLRIPVDLHQRGTVAVNLLMAQTLLGGTTTMSRDDLAERIEDLGATVTAEVDADAFLVKGRVLASALDPLLRLIEEFLVDAAYPEADVSAEQSRLIQRLRMARSAAGIRARETLHEHIFGTHPYGEYLPDSDAVAALTADDLRRAHAERIVAGEAVLVLVGDIDTERVVELVARRLGRWMAGTATATAPSLPPLLPDVSLLFHRPGSVQSSIRIGGPALRRDDRRFAPLQIANLLYGGYFSSRLVRNIREDKGYTYGPRSSIDHGIAGSTLIVEADVATAVTAPALLEMWYELGRLSTLRPTNDELADARQYASGTVAMSLATQSGLAALMITLAGAGLDVSWLSDHLDQLARVSAEDIYTIGVEVLAPCLLAVVVIGDATHTAAPLKAFGPWEVRT